MPTDNDMVAQPNTTLADLHLGESATVIALNNQGMNRRRMMDLGILPGTKVEIEMKSPLGDPVAYRVRGSIIALRNEQARNILIERTEGGKL